MDAAEIDDLCLAAGCQCKLFLDALEQARKERDDAMLISTTRFEAVHVARTERDQAQKERDELQGLAVTAEICFDRVVRERDQAQQSAKDARALAYEECAKVALDEKVDAESTQDGQDQAYNTACDHIAAAIRSMSFKKEQDDGK